jgi:hypothetical protein
VAPEPRLDADVRRRVPEALVARFGFGFDAVVRFGCALDVVARLGFDAVVRFGFEVAARFGFDVAARFGLDAVVRFAAVDRFVVALDFRLPRFGVTPSCSSSCASS